MAAAAREGLLQQLPPLGEPKQLPHPRIGGELRLVRQHLRAAQYYPTPVAVQIEDLFTFGDEDIEQLAAFPGARVAEPLAYRLPDPTEGEPAQALVEDPGDLGQWDRHRARRDLDEDRPHHPAPEVEHQKQALGGDGD